MAGIYIHIPFCRQACHYCNFHFSTSLKYKADLVTALTQELVLRKDYLGEDIIETIYLGGGTPSLLDKNELNVLMETIHKHYTVAPITEITLEANPDDLTIEKLKELKAGGINRLSIGIQSFDDKDLTWMNRSHNAIQARSSVEEAKALGYDNLSIDLIFGCPTSTEQSWAKNLELVAQLDVPHISCYGLTIEEKTALAHQVKTQTGQLPNEESNAEQFEITMKELNRQGYEQYEISNYAKNQLYSNHNTNYWKQVPYLGIGPSAHSFDGQSRQWNQANNSKYIKELSLGVLPSEKETLSPRDLYNEYILTQLRTQWGCRVEDLRKNHKAYVEHFLSEIESPIEKGLLQRHADTITLTQEGKYLADQITSELFSA